MKKIFIFVGIILLTTNSFSLDSSTIDFTKAKKYKGDFHIPYHANPNLNTLRYYMWRYISDTRGSYNSRTIKPSLKPYEFEFDLTEYEFLNKELKRKAIASYLYFEKGKVIIDKISPKDRLGELIDNKTRLRSNSMGKSLTSIILGHAICEGYIESVDTKINDWPLLKGSLYENHKLIDLLNMASGDQKYVHDSFLLKNGKANRNKGFEVDNMSAKFLGAEFKDKKASKKRIYNYNNVNTNLILNYALFKSNGNFDKLLNKIFQEKARIKHPVFFFKKDGFDDVGNADPMFYATRFDYLRIAKMMMDDYQNNTCFGKYLKEIYKRKIPKNLGNHDGMRGEPRFNRTFSYGGQFHLDWPGLKNRTVFAMGGRSGQAILVDMDSSRIIVLNSIHYNNDKYRFNEIKLLTNPIKNGEEAFK
jgi:CubicO group peptidase (beta-lactamase class C family)